MNGKGGENHHAEVPHAGAERRSDVRVAASFRVRYKSLDEFVVAYTADISRGGLFLQTHKFLPVGSVVRIELILPHDGPTLRIIARVAYLLNDVSRKGMGMEFLEVAGDQSIADQLAAYLTQTLTEESLLPQEEPAQILVVDDNSTYRERITFVMRKRGHRVIVASNGLDALGKVLRDLPDLILTDVHMPTMDGWQFVRLLRARSTVAHIPIIFLTILDSEKERLYGYQLGIDDYIAKPFQDDELIARVARVLQRARTRPRSTVTSNALRGDLSQVSLASVLSFIELEKRSGLLLLVSGSQLATLRIREGNVIGVDLPAGVEGKQNLDKLLFVLDWTKGQFELTAAEVSDEDEIGVSTSFALLEHARRRDERT